MEYITDTIQYPLYTSRAFRLYFENMKLGVLDIETTGLNPQRSQFVLGGLLIPRRDGLLVQQFFSEGPEHEQETLQAYLKAIEETDVLLTYNGQHFDIPFIKTRSRIRQMPFNLDLYLLVKNHCPIRTFLPNLKQKTVENFMGLWEHRSDEISGKESVDLYYRYLSEKDPVLKEKILLHNHDDVLQLYRLLAVLNKSDLHSAMYHMGFPVSISDPDAPGLTVKTISLLPNELKISGIQQRNPADYRRFELEGLPCSARFSRQEETFEVTVPLIRQAGFALVDLKTLKLDLPVFHKYPGCEEGFLILENKGNKQYLEINHFTKLFLERILDQWITNK